MLRAFLILVALVSFSAIAQQTVKLPARTDTSKFAFLVSEPIDRIGEESFQNEGEYPLNNVFRFVALRCGNCIPENRRNVDPKDITVRVETQDGINLLDDVRFSQKVNSATGAAQGTEVLFYLDGKVMKEGETVIIHIAYGNLYKMYNIVVYPPDVRN